MRKVTKEELNEILSKHKMWLNGEKDGTRADLSETDLSKADLRGADLSEADLSEADLKGANLTGADLIGANLIRANLIRANLTEADLSGADLMGADLCKSNLTRINLEGANLTWANLSRSDLRGADLRGVDLIRAVLTEADLSGADLTRAYLSGIYLTGAILNNTKINFPIACPEEGSFIGYKKARTQIIKLLITEDAQRSSATTRKCRCDKAKVLSITNLDGTAYLGNEVASNHDPNFIYKVGHVVSVDNFDPNRWNECSTGIHFFITREEAVEY